MANYVVSDTNLTNIANAIRGRSGESGQLEFPADFVSVINQMIGTSYLDGHLVDSVASAPVASFPDGANGQPMQVTASIEPVQDLHGQTSPWPAGGGKNLLDDSTLFHGFFGPNGGYNGNGNYISYMISLPAGTYTFSTDLENCFIPRYLIDDVGTQLSAKTQKITFTLIADGEFKITIRNSSTSDISAITPHSQIESGSYATAYVPFSNICPITGWTGCQVNRTGNNLIPTGTDTSNGYVADKYLKNDGTLATPSGSFVTYVSEYFEVEPSEGYAYKFTNNTWSATSVCFYDANKTFISGNKINGQTSISITTPSNAKYARASQVTYPNTLHFDFIRIDTYSVTFPTPPGTVYGGTLHINKDGTGVLVKKMDYVDLGTLDWKKSTRNQFYANDLTSVIKAPATVYVVANILCTQYKANCINDVYNKTNDNTIAVYSVDNYSGRLMIYDSSKETLTKEQFATAMSGVYLCYELATPVTYNISALALNSLLGVNNVWANTGNCAVEYSPDTDLWIQKVLAGESA